MIKIYTNMLYKNVKVWCCESNLVLYFYLLICLNYLVSEIMMNNWRGLANKTGWKNMHKNTFLFDKCGVLHYNDIFMNSQISHLKKAQFTWPKYFNVYSTGTSSGLENVEKNRELLDSYFFKVIIINSEFQTYIIWFCEPLNYLCMCIKTCTYMCGIHINYTYQV